MLKKIFLRLYVIALLIIISCNQERTQSIYKILAITGGHEFEPSFFQIFTSFKDIEYDTISQPEFNSSLNTDMAGKYNALVFYDMWQEISREQKAAFLALLNEGQGMIFLHHALVSYQRWDEFEKIIGGKYVEKDSYNDPNIKGSTYTHDITLDIKVVDKNHPVTSGIPDFSIFDEGYQYIQLLPQIHPLLATSHPNCTPTVAWTNSYGKSKIVYILLGHGREAHENEYYRKLIYNAVRWVGEAE